MVVPGTCVPGTSSTLYKVLVLLQAQEKMAHPLAPQKIRGGEPCAAYNTLLWEIGAAQSSSDWCQPLHSSKGFFEGQWEGMVTSVITWSVHVACSWGRLLIQQCPVSYHLFVLSVIKLVLSFRIMKLHRVLHDCAHVHSDAASNSGNTMFVSPDFLPAPCLLLAVILMSELKLSHLTSPCPASTVLWNRTMYPTLCIS